MIDMSMNNTCPFLIKSEDYLYLRIQKLKYFNAIEFILIAKPYLMLVRNLHCHELHFFT